MNANCLPPPLSKKPCQAFLKMSLKQIIISTVIKYFIDHQAEIAKIKQENRKLMKKLKGFITFEDALDEDDYDIQDFYFNFEDYEVFFERNAKRSDSDIMERRANVRKKMLDIHSKVYPQIKQLGVNCHWNEKNITSMICPCEFNKGRVGWIGVRYGKLKKEIDVVNQSLGQNEKDEIKGFQKHGCMQFCIVPNGFEINLFLAVKHDAIDRSYLQGNLDKLKTQIETEINKLRGYGMLWEIQNESAGERYIFELDKQNPNEFCNYLKKYDSDGCESYLKIFYDVNDERIKTKESIAEEVITFMQILNPLYNKMVWRPNI